ncbi:hypothetical protein J2Z21_005909 [Streptomyces griseochromogenes]|uniref:Uncharacterized protein n=1 Tax=Streptomyces griseochromogenes TaxID=68214 RepID=A0A1B1APE2_9ACTN|nr:hypothetical protein AVL59_01500 [Streptomyces griseochromogenes]MBP2052920.1 hypothetical protein [Streptomyces griseochromogenes]
METHLPAEERGEVDCPGSGFGSGVAWSTAAVRTLRLGTADRDLQRFDVDIPTAEAGRLPRAEWAICAETDHETPAWAAARPALTVAGRGPRPL